jgi:hypothetical protein
MEYKSGGTIQMDTETATQLEKELVTLQRTGCVSVLVDICWSDSYIQTTEYHHHHHHHRPSKY